MWVCTASYSEKYGKHSAWTEKEPIATKYANSTSNHFIYAPFQNSAIAELYLIWYVMSRLTQWQKWKHTCYIMWPQGTKQLFITACPHTENDKSGRFFKGLLKWPNAQVGDLLQVKHVKSGDVVEKATKSTLGGSWGCMNGTHKYRTLSFHFVSK